MSSAVASFLEARDFELSRLEKAHKQAQERGEREYFEEEFPELKG